MTVINLLETASSWNNGRRSYNDGGRREIGGNGIHSPVKLERPSGQNDYLLSIYGNQPAVGTC
jgi:hypothetical protein